jgi:hypothetical protein
MESLSITRFLQNSLNPCKFYAMGAKFTFSCKGCGYSVTASSGLDYGMVAVTKTFICRKCINIVDICVGEYGITYTMEEILQKERGSDSLLSFFSCPVCGSGEELEEWNTANRTCPKCSGRMRKDRMGPVMLWE